MTLATENRTERTYDFVTEGRDSNSGVEALPVVQTVSISSGRSLGHSQKLTRDCQLIQENSLDSHACYIGSPCNGLPFPTKDCDTHIDRDLGVNLSLLNLDPAQHVSSEDVSQVDSNQAISTSSSFSVDNEESSSTQGSSHIPRDSTDLCMMNSRRMNPYSRIYRRKAPSDPKHIPPQFHFKKPSKHFYNNIYSKMKLKMPVFPGIKREFLSSKKQNLSTTSTVPVTCYNHSSDLRRLYHYRTVGTKYKLVNRVKPTYKRKHRLVDNVLSTKYGKVGKLVGEGASGYVRLIHDPDGSCSHVAKVFRPPIDKKFLRRYVRFFIAEYSIASTLHHPNIVQVYDIIYAKHTIIQVLEYTPLDLFSFVVDGHCVTDKADQLFYQLLHGIYYMHSVGLAHRDIKLDNLMLDKNYNLKIIDFGTAFVFHYPLESTMIKAQGLVGSKPYVAPEVLSGKPYDPRAIDYWSCAVVYCCITNKKFPWRAPDESNKRFKTFLTQIKDPTLEIELINSLPENSRTAIKGMLDPDAEKRWDIAKVLNTSWMKETALSFNQSKQDKP
ncbi:HAL protein kinase Ppk8 [Schizosaccharomyces cryophilus OY26]|uniref:non-specific serine/threonine protein kinase n=1 Tax=Schizosaccharomyces cryophilus (strain OY26 / ATCC MYA-4695 / CBS 11777 / NBRC 106824 / NRRL Y48691) TaxID=653667 RepID=S9W8E1_SCHCR|nr:HAL protein kinase Ppk8 [Schizosaccharomyces cryophilus OY26]EPY54085.1 HAL protein kinase Ppk8 [Schizosaccharomyces cryophilus OY26]